MTVTTTVYDDLTARLNRGCVLVLDAGVATEIERRGVAMTDGVWAARSALDHFDTVVDTHMAYIAAGADVITANTYATSRIVLEPYELGALTRDVNMRSLEAAMVARERAGCGDVAVAASLSHFVPIPTGQSIQPKDDGLAYDTMRAAADEMCSFFAEAGVDLILLEMMSLPSRMAPVFDAVAHQSLPAWCGYSVLKSDGSIPGISAGELVARHDASVRFDEIVALGTSNGFDVHGVMHAPSDITHEALRAISSHFDGPLMAYPDSGFFKAPNWQFVDVITPAELIEFCEIWTAAGCQVIGGCCGLGPEHTAAQRLLADRLNAPLAIERAKQAT